MGAKRIKRKVPTTQHLETRIRLMKGILSGDEAAAALFEDDNFRREPSESALEFFARTQGMTVDQAEAYCGVLAGGGDFKEAQKGAAEHDREKVRKTGGKIMKSLLIHQPTRRDLIKYGIGAAD